MESITPNLLSNPQANPLLEKSSQIMRTKVFLLLMFVFSYAGISAQVSTLGQHNDPVVVTEINTYLTSANKLSNASTSLNAQNLKGLISKVQPSTYYYSSEVKTYGDKPVNLFTDLASLNQIDNAISLKNDIEIVIIKIDNAAQLNQSIDLSLLSGFKKLKYIYVVSNVKVTSDTIARMIVNYNEKYSVFYKIDKGDNNQ
jgi:hypothetical protein